MSLLLPFLAQMLHLLLVLLAAPGVVGLLHGLEARLSGRSPPDWRAPWQELARLVRKQRLRAETASPLVTVAPVLSAAVLVLAAALVPSFSLGMTLAPLSDLLVVLGLLALARMSLALAALEPGTAAAGVAVRQSVLRALLAEPALIAVVLALGLAAGTTNLDLIAELQQADMVRPLAAMALAGAALVLVALAQPGLEAADGERSGGDLALLQYAGALHLLVWLDLVGALFLPIGMGSAQDFPGGWMLGLLGWAARVLLSVAALAGLRAGTGRLHARRQPALLLVALLLAGLAGMLVLSHARPV